MSSSWIKSECFERKGVGFAWLGHYLLVMVVKSREKDIYLELKTWFAQLLFCLASAAQVVLLRMRSAAAFHLEGGGRC